jgi:diguanylate cyclase (GGDEF)-like protein
MFLSLCFTGGCLAMPQDVTGQWFEAPSAGWSYGGQSHLERSKLTSVAGVAATGGHFWFEGDFEIHDAGRQVLAFKNTNIIDHFTHRVFDAKGRLVATLQGGIGSTEDNPFFLRLGRELELPVGRYRLISELSSPFFLAQPELYMDDLADYRQSLKAGNTLALVGMGIFLGLGVYYAALAVARRRMAEGMYALFILGNFLFNGDSLLLFPDLLGIHWIYLASYPIVFSNCAYIAFVLSLLEIRREEHPYVYHAALIILGVLGLFALLALVKPDWSLELARYGVGLFLLFGLTAGIVRARRGSVTAKLYLVSIAVFFVLGAVAITQSRLDGLYTLTIEHVGMLAVAVEVILLALVLAYQFAQLHQEKRHMLERLRQSDHMARTDSLTGLPNRFALDAELERLPQDGSLSFVDMDNLKYYNDTFGHAHGDTLLRRFSQLLAAALGDRAKLYRVGGDEFAVACPSGDTAWIDGVLADVIAAMHGSGFELAGASAGHAHLDESDDAAELKHLADVRMYEQKQKRKALAPGMTSR